MVCLKPVGEEEKRSFSPQPSSLLDLNVRPEQRRGEGISIIQPRHSVAGKHKRTVKVNLIVKGEEAIRNINISSQNLCAGGPDVN
jgi:hypothetical protein